MAQSEEIKSEIQTSSWTKVIRFWEYGSLWTDYSFKSVNHDQK